MTRHIAFFISTEGDISNISPLIARITGYKYSPDTGAIIISGFGEDLGYRVIYDLSNILYAPDGVYDREAAYKLKHSWL